ncbi:cadmium-translocating P-type ATPase [Candidatus Woesebacteria bacterium]|nr:cadmium-translocating P-type ATPase [Candidatus Woesebacteria bacterium]
METNVIYHISLIAAYIAGMVALFAPCCISYLFPAYLGNIFRERKQVLFMTFVYSLGIFVIMMPVVLGANALQKFFFRLHDQTYFFGAIFMFIVAGLSLLGIRMPLPHIVSVRGRGKTDVVSTFVLGIFSGITSACCAPVLIGVLALSSLTPSVFQALGVGAAYVFGMVTPLYIASAIIHKKNILQKPFLRKVLTTITIGKNIFPIFLSNVIAFFVFALTATIMLLLTATGGLGMSVAESAVAKQINRIALEGTAIVNTLPGLDVIFAIMGIYLIMKFLRTVFEKQKSNQQHDRKYVCPMHANVVSDVPGTCPKCGGMKLVPVGIGGTSHNKEHGDHKHHDHAGHDHASMMVSPQAAADFLKRFYIVTVLLVPLIAFGPGAAFFGMTDFALRPYIQLTIASVIFYFALVFFEHAKHEIAAKQYGMMTLVSLAVGAGFGFSVLSTFVPGLSGEFYLEISTLIWILLFGHYLEAKSSTAAGNALQEVAQLLPKQAHLLYQGDFKDVPVEQLVENDIVLVKPGEKVPADGTIEKGSAHMDESLISGESKPLSKKKGDTVIAGSICLDGSLQIRLRHVGGDSTIGHIQRLIADAQKTKPTAQKIADKAARILTFTALGGAILAITFWTGIVHKPFSFSFTLAITALVIACPHALGLAIPTVSTIATSLAVKNGVFLKDLEKIEIIKQIRWVVFDKTGTLTKGVFGVNDISTLHTMKKKEIMSIAASLEQHSSHIIGASIVAYVRDKKVRLHDVRKFKSLAGKGVEGFINGRKYTIANKVYMQGQNVYSPEAEKQFARYAQEGKTVVFLSDEKNVLGIIALSDEIKPESKRAIQRLHKLRIKVAMLTGDNTQVATQVSQKLGIDSFFAEVLPEEKYTHIKKLQKGGNRVMMVGDGVNDAPGLTQADVGVAIGAGTDVAVEAGDVVLTRNNPEDVVRLIILSRKVYKKMFENLVWATAYNLIAIPAAIGAFARWGFFLKPQIGAILMALSSVIVVANALALKKEEIY